MLDPFYPRFWEERLEGITSRQELRGIFVCDMGDLFGIGVPEHWTWRIINLIAYAEQHRFYLLTKQPQNLIKFSPFPENCYVGVTYCGSGLAKEGKAQRGFTAIHAHMSEIEAKVKFISFEPLLSPCTPVVESYGLDIFDWVIIGACTGTYPEVAYLKHQYPDLTLMPCGREHVGVHRWTAQPRIEWVREIVEAADRAGTPVFLKDNLEPLFLNAKMYWEGFYAGSFKHTQGLRQEMPNV